MGVLYRCKGDDCEIRTKDKINERSYYLYFDYQGFFLEHQDPNMPVKLLSENNFLSESVQFLENTNIVYLNWEVIEYKEEKGIFGKTLDKTLGINKTYYAGYYKTKEAFTDDGHMRAFPQTQ